MRCFDSAKREERKKKKSAFLRLPYFPEYKAHGLFSTSPSKTTYKFELRYEPDSSTCDVYEEPRYCYAWKLIVMPAVIRITIASKVKISLFKTLQTSWLRQKHLKLTDILENTLLSTFNPCNRTHFSQRRLTLSFERTWRTHTGTPSGTSLILFVTTGFQEAIRGHTGTGSDPFQLSSRESTQSFLKHFILKG